MTEQEKQLLFQDLCARLPYGVKCGILTHPNFRLPHWKKENDLWYHGRPQAHTIDIRILGVNPIDCFYPFLRPMSSMTEEEKKDFIEVSCYEVEETVNGRHYEYYLKDYVGTTDNPTCNYDAIDWLNQHHFDYRGLIEKGLALEAPDGMYKIGQDE